MSTIDELRQAERAAATVVQGVQARLHDEETAGSAGARETVRAVLERASQGEAVDVAAADQHTREHLVRVAALRLELQRTQLVHARAVIALEEAELAEIPARRLAAAEAIERAEAAITEANRALNQAQRDRNAADQHYGSLRDQIRKRREDAARLEETIERDLAATTAALVGGTR